MSELPGSGKTATFQFRYEFFRRRRVTSYHIRTARRVSIPVWGSHRRDPVTRREPLRRRNVSIPVWVFSPSRPECAVSVYVGIRVSIPVWGFSPSRHMTVEAGTLFEWPFQSQLGFSPRRDSARLIGICTSALFQFRFGVPLRRDVDDVPDRLAEESFRSRFGFSPLATADEEKEDSQHDHISIPVWGFPLRDLGWKSVHSPYNSFCGSKVRPLVRQGAVHSIEKDKWMSQITLDCSSGGSSPMSPI